MVIHGVQTVLISGQLLLILGLHQVDADAVVEQLRAVEVEGLRPLYQHKP